MSRWETGKPVGLIHGWHLLKTGHDKDRLTLEEVWDRDTEFLFCTLCLQYLWDIQVDCALSLEAYQSGAGVNCTFENIKAEWMITVLSRQRLRLFSKECEAREGQGRRWKPRGCMPSRWKWRWTS